MKMFAHAFRGIWTAVKTERNVRIHLAAVFYVVICGLSLEFISLDWALAGLACGLVIGAELFNAAIERLCDVVEPEKSPAIKAIKDIAAGAVLVCAIAAIAVAGHVFLGRILYMGFPLQMNWLVFWIGVAALPFWVWFVFWFGKKKGENT